MMNNNLNTNMLRRNISYLFLTVIALVTISCDFSHELPDANSKEDETLPDAFFTYVTSDNWYTLKFANGSTNASSYEWDFGDGRDILTELPEVTLNDVRQTGIVEYAQIEDEAVTYTVTCTATDGNGEFSVYSEDVVIEFDENNQGEYDTYTAEYTIVNTYDDADPVSLVEFSSEESSKSNFAKNVLDDDIATRWAANDAGDDGEYAIYDLSTSYDLSLIRLSFLIKPDEVYGYQLHTSNTGVTDSDFSVLLPASGGSDLEFIAGDAGYIDVDVDVNARYIKLVVFGRFNESDNSIVTSDWTNVNGIKFYTDVIE